MARLSQAFRPVHPDAECAISYGEVARWGRVLGARDYLLNYVGRGHEVFESFKASGAPACFDGAAELIFKTAYVTGAREKMRALGHAENKS